jgi:hypothetical protein
VSTQRRPRGWANRNRSALTGRAAPGSVTNAEVVTAKLGISDVGRALADLADMKEKIGSVTARSPLDDTVVGALKAADGAIERFTADAGADLENKRSAVLDLEAKVVALQAKVDALQVRGPAFHSSPRDQTLSLYFNFIRSCSERLTLREPPQESLDSRELAAAKVGEFYEHGWGGAEQSAELARDYYRKAGNKGEEGLRRVDEADRIKAELQQLTEAAAGGDTDAQLRLGTVLEYGQMGSAVDVERAELMYRKAADVGNSQAQYALGLFITKVSAKKYLQLAADQGIYDASYCVSKINDYF